MFESVASQVNLPELEEQILRLWREKKIYDQSLANRRGQPRFVFYEGPPTANGLPHPGHCLTRAIKDLFPRYQTMRGKFCERKAGWDTHGLPVEVEVCKELGIHSKEEIEAYGVEPFIQRCQQSVWRYMQEWERLTERIGFWIKLDEAYVTYHQSYVESVWWALKSLFDRGLLYQGHKIVWWWAQGGTALSSGEVGQGYREVADPSVYVRFPLLDDAGQPKNESLLVWTTTPWTLPSNQFAAVHPDLEYAVVAGSVAEHPEQLLIVATALLETLQKKLGGELTVRRTVRGSELVGRRYAPPFDCYSGTLGDKQGRLAAGGQEHVAWRVVAADFVTTDSGTGVVHQAPAFGEVDFEVLQREQARFLPGQGPELICAVGPDGKFTAEAGEYAGRWVKDCDRDITRELRQRGLLWHQEQYLHEYPFCWRAEQDPLIQYPRKSWFIRTSQFREQMLSNNQQINWLPEHIRDGRFGNFLETNVDWALSRERYWGTPLPIWVCEQTGEKEAIASYAELLAKPGVQGTEVWLEAKKKQPDLVEDLKVHKPYIDAVTYASPFAPGARMRRVSEVIDCWFDSGAMPFAQWGYPHQGQDQFQGQFPADFISEALDQTRGWFYSQLAISTLLFGDQAPEENRQPYPHPFRNCIVLGLMLAEWWESKDGKRLFLTEEDAVSACGQGQFAQRTGKMSKSKRNYREPQEIFNRYGADALRWYFFANQAPWTSIRYSEQAIRDSIPEFLLRLWNVYSFFVIYANIDGFDPAVRLAAADWKAPGAKQLDAATLAAGRRAQPLNKRTKLDRWILNELDRTCEEVVAKLDSYDNFAACGILNRFVDALSNWFVRRSRSRYWSGRHSNRKHDAYWTLYECLLTTARMIAPFTPFLAEALWQNLAVAALGERVWSSVHLCEYPRGNAKRIVEELSAETKIVRDVVSLGHKVRESVRMKVRQPLAKIEIIASSTKDANRLKRNRSLIKEELNVKNVEVLGQGEGLVRYLISPDQKKLGPRLGKQLQFVKEAIAALDPEIAIRTLETKGELLLTLKTGDLVAIRREELQIRLEALPGFAAAHGEGVVVVLSKELSDDLRAEGIARELIHVVQTIRKTMSLEYTERIEVFVGSQSAQIEHVVNSFGEMIKKETLATSIWSCPVMDERLHERGVADSLRMKAYSLGEVDAIVCIERMPHRSPRVRRVDKSLVRDVISAIQREQDRTDQEPKQFEVLIRTESDVLLRVIADCAKEIQDSIRALAVHADRAAPNPVAVYWADDESFSIQMYTPGERAKELGYM